MRLFKLRRDPTDPVDRVDRFWRSRRLRLVAGLFVDDDFSVISGAIVRAHGEGKYLHFEPITAAQTELRSELSTVCRTICREGGIVTEFEVHKNDLAVAQAELLNRLRTSCGAVGESLLAVCVADPGLWIRDFDGKSLYASFCNPDLLSAFSGVSVIDALPAKDLAAGGHGRPLTPLACWLVAADRTSPVAKIGRLLVQVEHGVELYLLPASDGLDDEYPQIRFGRIPRLRWPDSHGDGLTTSTILSAESDSSNDTVSQELLDAWSDAWEHRARDSAPQAQETDLANRTAHLVNVQKLSQGRWAASARSWTLRQLESLAAEFQLSSIPELQVVISGERAVQGNIRAALQRTLPRALFTTLEDHGLSAGSFSAVLTSALGAMHIDQMPANLPWLTGVESPRILGRLTPGSPKQWRMLLREMADHHPGTMRLRDAV